MVSSGRCDRWCKQMRVTEVAKRLLGVIKRTCHLRRYEGHVGLHVILDVEVVPRRVQDGDGSHWLCVVWITKGGSKVLRSYHVVSVVGTWAVCLRAQSIDIPLTPFSDIIMLQKQSSQWHRCMSSELFRPACGIIERHLTPLLGIDKRIPSSHQLIKPFVLLHEAPFCELTMFI